MSPRAASLAWLLAAGCAGRPSRPVVAPPPVAPTATPPRPAPLPAAIAPRAPRPPAGEVARLFQSTPDTHRRVELMPAVGPLRRFVIDGRPAEAEGDVVRFAVGAFREREVDPLPAPDGWRFVAGGGVWSSAGFLGPYRFVAGVEGAFAGRGVGRPTFVRGGAAEGLTLPSAVIDVAFSDGARGVAIVEPGVALITQDGARWRPVTGLGEPPLSVLALADARWVLGATRSLRIDPAGAARRGALDDTPGPVEDPDDLPRRLVEPPPSDWYPLAFLDDTRRRVLAAQRGPAPDAPRVFVADVEGVLRRRALDDTRRWVPQALRDAVPEPARYFVYDLAEGRALDDVEPPRGCGSPQFFGAGRLFVTCASEGGATLHERGDDGAWWERLAVRWCARPSDDDTLARCYVSATGERVACEGRCAEGDACGPGANVCERVGTEAPRWRGAGSIADPWRVAGYDGEELVLADQRRFLRHARAVRGDGAEVPLATNPGLDDRRIVLPFPSIGRDGRMRIVARVIGTGLREVWEGRVGGAFEVRAMPPWATTVTETAAVQPCGDDGELLAIAEDGTPWVSTHAERAWHPLIPPGAPRELAGVTWRDRGQEPANCHGLGWWDEGVSVVGWGEPAVGPESELSFGRPMAEPPESETRWQCELGSVPGGRQQESPDHQLRWTHIGAIRDDGAETVVAAPQDGRRGPRPGRLTLPRALPPELSVFFTLDVTRERALLLTRTRWPAALYSVASSGAVVRLWQAPPGAPSELTRPAVARDGGSYAMLSENSYGWEPHERGTQRLALFVWTPGRAPSLVALSLAGGRHGAYALGAEAGWLGMRPDGAVLGGRAGALPRVIARAVRHSACGPAARGDFVWSGQVADVGVDGNPVAYIVEEHYRLDGDVLCRDSVVIGDVVMRAGDAGYVSRPGWVPLRCTPPSG